MVFTKQFYSTKSNINWDMYYLNWHLFYIMIYMICATYTWIGGVYEDFRPTQLFVALQV